MATRAPLVLGDDGLPQRLQSGDTLGTSTPPALGSGGTVGRFIRPDGSGGWVNAASTDTHVQLATVAYRISADEVRLDGVVTGLSGLTPGPQWLNTDGQFSAVPPTPTSTVRAKQVGVALSASILRLTPDERPIGAFP